jgi:hypothetical protein
MADPIESLKKEAKTAFVGRGPVLGVGITEDAEERLIFLLREASPSAEQEITSWGLEHSVGVEFMVTGQIRGLSSR